MKKWMFYIIIFCVLVMHVSAYAAGAYYYFGEDSPNTLFTGSMSGHNLVLSSAGVLTAWGNNEDGQCGAEPCETAELTRITLETDDKIVKVAAGNNFSLILDEAGNLWGLGSNEKKQLGAENSEARYTAPVLICTDVLDIAAGEDLSAVLMRTGEVYLFGDGQMETKVNHPDGKIVKIALFGRSLALSSDTNVVTFYSFLPTGERIVQDIRFEEKEVLSFAVGKAHCTIAVDGGDCVEIYTVGSNEQYQRGIIEDEETNLDAPSLVLSFDKEEVKNVMVYAGAHYSVVSTWNSLGVYERVTDYVWGTGFDEYDWHKNTGTSDALILPESFEAAHRILGICEQGYLVHEYMDDSIITCGRELPFVSIPVIEPEGGTQRFYPYQYEEIPYHTYKVNFVELCADTFSDANQTIDPDTGETEEKYAYWEYVDETHFCMKEKNLHSFTTGYYDFEVLALDRAVTGENRKIACFGHEVCAFAKSREFYQTEAQAEAHAEDSICFTVTAETRPMSGRPKPLLIPQEVPVFYEAPGTITEETKLGLYVYGLPEGVSATVSDIESNTFKITLSGNSWEDVDYDRELYICYVYVKNEKADGKLGDFDLREVFAHAQERRIRGFAIKARENTEETLKIDGSLIRGKENGKKVTATIIGGTFASMQTPQLWEVNGLEGVTVSEVLWKDAHTVELTLSGNSKQKYEDGVLSVSCLPDAYADNRVMETDAYGAETFKEAPLTAENEIVVKKQTKSSGGGSATVYVTVCFETDGGSEIKEKKIAKNAQVKFTEEPIKKGYRFMGWYADKELTVPYDENARVTGNITLYAAWEDRRIVLTIGETNAMVFGKTIENDVAPVIQNDRTMLPIRMLAESLGADVTWDEETRTVMVQNGETVIKITIDEVIAKVNGEEIALDSAAFIENNRTYLPLRFISEHLGAEVDYNEEHKTVTIIAE